MSVLTDAGRSAWGFLSRTDRPVGWWDTECCMCPQTLLFSQSTRWTTSTAYGSRNGVKCFSEMGGYFFWTSPGAANLSPDFTYTPEHSHGSFASSDAPTAAAPQQKWAQQHAACPGFCWNLYRVWAYSHVHGSNCILQAHAVSPESHVDTQKLFWKKTHGLPQLLF